MRIPKSLLAKILFSLCCIVTVSLQATWLPTINVPPIPAGIGLPVANPDVKLDSTGNAVSVFQGIVTPSFKGVLQGSTLPFLGAWTSPEQISLADHDVNQQALAVDPAGNAVTVWQNADNIIYGATKPFGGLWTAPVVIAAIGVGPQVAVDPLGNAVAVWSGSATNTVQSATLPFGGSWTMPVDISMPGGTEAQVGVDSTGNAYAVWSWFDGANNVIQVSKLPFGGSWEGPATIPSGNSTVPQIAVSGLTLVEVSLNTTNGVIQGARSKDGGMTGMLFPSISSGPSSGPQVVLDSAGNATAVWSENGTAIQYSSLLYTSDVWTTPVVLSGSGAVQVEAPQIAVDGAGNTIVVWTESDGVAGESLIKTVVISFGGSVSPITTLSATGQFSTTPQIAMNLTGNGVAIWNNQTQNIIQSATWFIGPIVTNVNPNSGPVTGGNTVVITGINFLGVTEVKFGSSHATSFSINSDTQITAIVPAGSIGTVDVTVTQVQGTSPIMDGDKYTYQNIAPIPSVPLPPSNFKGWIKENHFLNTVECILESSWTASPSPNVVAYRIYKKNNVIATISANSKLSFERQLSKCKAKGYSIAAVNEATQESNRIPLKIVR